MRSSALVFGLVLGSQALGGTFVAHSVSASPTTGFVGTGVWSGGYSFPTVKSMDYIAGCKALAFSILNPEGDRASVPGASSSFTGLFQITWEVDWVGPDPMPVTGAGILQVSETQSTPAMQVLALYTGGGSASATAVTNCLLVENDLAFTYSGNGFRATEVRSSSSGRPLPFYRVEVSPGVYRLRATLYASVNQQVFAYASASGPDTAMGQCVTDLRGSFNLVSINNQTVEVPAGGSGPGGGVGGTPPPGG